MEINDRITELEKKMDANIKDNEANIEQTISDLEKIHDKNEEKPKMTQEQANAVMEIAKNPKDFIGTKVSAEINNLIESNDAVKDKISDIAKDTTMTGIETFSTANAKQRKSNYFELNEKDITPLGGDKTSSKGQQIIIVAIRRLFWMLIMSTLGFFYIAGLTVMVELFQGISFKKIEKEEIKENGESKTKQYITRTKLGKAGSVIGFIVGILLDAAILAGNIFFPLIYLNISVCVFAVMIIINACSNINLSKLKWFKHNKNDGEDMTISNTSTVVIEEDE